MLLLIYGEKVSTVGEVC